jgi:hypothetical protein
MDRATYVMSKFKEIKFEQDTRYPHETFNQQPKYNANYTVNKLTLSIAYGGGCYGDGPGSDSYEVALFKDDHMIRLTEFDDVAGWKSAEDIDKIIDVMGNNPTLLIEPLASILQ